MKEIRTLSQQPVNDWQQLKAATDAFEQEVTASLPQLSPEQVALEQKIFRPGMDKYEADEAANEQAPTGAHQYCWDCGSETDGSTICPACWQKLQQERRKQS